MNRTGAAEPASTIPIIALGSATCEDTAITRSRLDSLGVPYDYVDIDLDRVAARRVAALNGGHRVTPTVIVGDEKHVLAEPTIEQVDELVREAGHHPSLPAARQLHGDAIERAVPIQVLGSPVGDVSLATLRGRRQVALFLAHGAGCLACFGYARQLAEQGDALAEADAAAVIVVTGTVDDTAGWRPHIAESAIVAADREAAWKRAVTGSTGVSAGDAVVLVLDRYLAPRAVSSAPEAGGLVAPPEVTEWHRFVALDCPECSGELPWDVESGA